MRPRRLVRVGVRVRVKVRVKVRVRVRVGVRVGFGVRVRLRVRVRVWRRRHLGLLQAAGAALLRAHRADHVHAQFALCTVQHAHACALHRWRHLVQDGIVEGVGHAEDLAPGQGQG